MITSSGPKANQNKVSSFSSLLPLGISLHPQNAHPEVARPIAAGHVDRLLRDEEGRPVKGDEEGGAAVEGPVQPAQGMLAVGGVLSTINVFVALDVLPTRSVVWKVSA